MMHGSKSVVGQRNRRTIFIATLIATGVCLFALTVGLSFCLPLSVEGEIGSSDGLDWMSQ